MCKDSVRAGEAGRDCGPRSRLGSRTIVKIFINSSKNTGSTGQAQAAGGKKNQKSWHKYR